MMVDRDSTNRLIKREPWGVRKREIYISCLLLFVVL